MRRITREGTKISTCCRRRSGSAEAWRAFTTFVDGATGLEAVMEQARQVKTRAERIALTETLRAYRSA